MKYKFFFHSPSKILMLQTGEQLTDALMAEVYWAIRTYAAATKPSAGVWDFSGVTDCTVSPEMLRDIAGRRPALDAACPRYVVAPASFGMAASCLFEIAAKPFNPLLKFVLSREEAFAALGLKSPKFEPLA